MTEGDCPSIRVYVIGIVGQPKLSQAGKRLRSERFVDFDNIDFS
jgi:hypothetical protein